MRFVSRGGRREVRNSGHARAPGVLRENDSPTVQKNRQARESDVEIV